MAIPIHIRLYSLIILLFGLCAFGVSNGGILPAAYAQDTAVPASKYITEVQFDANGKSNLNELTKVPGKDSLVLFYDTNHLNSEAFKNEHLIFEELANKYSGQIDFYMYDVSKDNGYKGDTCWGIETNKEKIEIGPSVKMFKDGKEYDIRQGGPKTEYIKVNLERCDYWIRYNLTDEFNYEPTSWVFENSFNIREVQRSIGPKL